MICEGCERTVRWFSSVTFTVYSDINMGKSEHPSPQVHLHMQTLVHSPMLSPSPSLSCRYYTNGRLHHHHYHFSTTTTFLPPLLPPPPQPWPIHPAPHQSSQIYITPALSRLRLNTQHLQLVDREALSRNPGDTPPPYLLPRLNGLHRARLNGPSYEQRLLKACIRRD